MRVQRLQHISSVYPSGRHDDVRGFYGNLLGLLEITPPATLTDRDLVWFSAGANELELHFFPGVVGSEHPRHFCLEVEDLETARRQLQASGYEPYEGSLIPNRPRFFCRDPFGNLLEFTTILGSYLR